MSVDLLLAKEKAKFYLRFNENHDENGRFASSDSSGGSGSSSAAAHGIEEITGQHPLGTLSKSDYLNKVGQADGLSSPDGKMKHITLYHGSNADFDEFDYDKGKEGKDSGADQYGEGFYFTTDPEVARNYGDNIYKVDVAYSTSRRVGKKTGREKDFEYNPDTGYWVIPKDKSGNLRIISKESSKRALDLAKLKFDVRFNPNHDEHGRFSDSDSSGSGGGSSSSEHFSGSGTSPRTGISYDFKGKDEKFAESQEMIEDLASEYTTRLQTVTTGAKQAAGATQISGAVIQLNSGNPSDAAHEFAHSMAMENATKFGLSHDEAFWKEIKSAQRSYKKDVGQDVTQWISTYEHGQTKGSDEFFAEAFTLGKLVQKGMDVPSKYGSGKAIEHAKKVVSIADKYFGKSDKRAMDMKTGDSMNNDLEIRSYTFDLQAENTEAGGIVTGRPIVYESRTNLGLFDEVIERGALDKTDLHDVRFLVNHDTSKIPLARSRNNNANSTMQLIPDDKGLQVKVKLDIENNTEARNLYSAIKRGDVSGMSFMFSVAKNGDNWDFTNSQHPERRIKQISNVVEVSAVTFPAYEESSISVRNKEALDSAKLALESAKRSQKEALESEARSELELAKAKYEFKMKVGM